MEDFNMVNDMEVVTEAPQETEATTSEVTEEVTTEPVVETAKPQSAEENARFAAARREEKARADAAEAKLNRLMAAVSQYGYPDDPEAAADALMAQTQGISVEEATAQREAQEQADRERQAKDGELNYFKNIAIEKMMADDLTKIKEVYTDVKVKSLKELGDEFFSILKATQNPVLAYATLQQVKQMTAKPIPQDIGAVNSSSSKEKDFYTSEEIDKLTSADYDRDPKLLEKVRKSIHRLGR